ncbi:MAG: RDD family protein [Paucibacter sp.]|nr:RDD family protein [Roseateles sp.]
MDDSSTTANIKYVGFWARVGAALIDTIVVLVVFGLLGALLGVHATVSLGQSALGWSLPSGPELLVNHLLPAVAVVFCWLKFGATPGKRVIGAEVVDAKTLKRLSTGQALLRYVGYYVSTVPLGLGLIWVAFDSRKQGWHDKIAGTVVIRR